jgi:hypothetical protein
VALFDHYHFRKVMQTVTQKEPPLTLWYPGKPNAPIPWWKQYYDTQHIQMRDRLLFADQPLPPGLAATKNVDWSAIDAAPAKKLATKKKSASKGAKKPSGKKAPAKRKSADKASAKKASGKKAPAKKTTSKKASAKKATKTRAKRPSVKKKKTPPKRKAPPKRRRRTTK